MGTILVSCSKLNKVVLRIAPVRCAIRSHSGGHIQLACTVGASVNQDFEILKPKPYGKFM